MKKKGLLFMEQKEGEEKRIYARKDAKEEEEEEVKEPAKKRSRKEESSSEDSDEESYLDMNSGAAEEELQVDFDFFNQEEEDRWPVEAFVRALLAGCVGKSRAEMISEPVTMAILKADVGSVIKSEGYKEALGVICAVRLDEIAKSDAGKAVIAAAKVRDEDVEKTALLVSERIINMPVIKLAPAMHRLLWKEIGETEFKAEQFVLVVPFDVPKGGKEREYIRQEEEIFVKHASSAVELPPRSEESEKLTMTTTVSRAAVACIIPRAKMPTIIKEITAMYDF